MTILMNTLIIAVLVTLAFLISYMIALVKEQDVNHEDFEHAETGPILTEETEKTEEGKETLADLIKQDFETIYTLVIEECAELQQSITKIKRFGLESINPYENITNYESLVKEMADVQACVTLLQVKFSQHNIDPEIFKKVDQRVKEKVEKLVGQTKKEAQ